MTRKAAMNKTKHQTTLSHTLTRRMSFDPFQSEGLLLWVEVTGEGVAP